MPLSEAVAPVPRRTLLSFAALVLVAASMSAGAVAALFRQTQGLKQPVTITACTPDDFADGRCDAPVDPGVLTLSADLAIPVSGQVCLEESAAYDVDVSWVHIDSDTEFSVLSTPITWDEGCGDPYAIEWVPPAQLLASELEPGQDLGRWRIVGTARPVDPSRYATYSWDSVKTFELVAEQ